MGCFQAGVWLRGLGCCWPWDILAPSWRTWAFAALQHTDCLVGTILGTPLREGG